MKKKFTFLMAALMLLTMINLPGKAVGQTTLTTGDLDFGTPQFSENFNSLSTTSATATINSDSQTAYGIFNKMYNNNTGNTYAIASNNTFGSNVLSLSAGSGSPLIASITKSGGSAVTFGTTGAFSVKVAKTDVSYFGLYAADDNNAFAKASGSVFIQNNAGALSINNGNKSNYWVSIGSYTSNDIIEICVIYNNTNSSATYGGTISLASKKAHIYVNGTCVMDGENPKAFTIPGSSLTVFRVLPLATSGNKCTVDDVKIYNSLPTAASSDPTINVSPTSLTGFTYSHGNGPSAAQSFSVSGSSLSSNLVIAAPTDYELCTTANGTYSESISLTPSSGAVSSTTIYARLKAGKDIGNYNSENVTLNSTDAEEKTVSLSGSVTGYTLTYSGNGNTGGTVPTDATAYEKGASVTVLGNTGSLVKTHYSFSGWSRDIGGTPKTYAAGDTLIIKANTTVNAVWTPITHTFSTAVTPDNSGTVVAKDGGDNTIASGSSVAETAQLTLTASPAEGYNFTSWSDGGNNSTLSSTTTNPTTFTMGTANVTITATFTARTPATVTLHDGLNGATETEVNTYTDATFAEVIEGHDIASVNGWTALGWVKSYTSGTPTLITTSEAVGETEHLYAVYSKGSNIFTLINDVNDISINGNYMIGYDSKIMKNVKSTYYMGYTTSNEISDGSFEYVDGRVFILGGTTGAYTFYDGSKYLSATGGSSYQQNLGLSENATTNYEKWSIGFSNNTAQITNNGNTSYMVAFRTGNSYDYFNCYTSTSVNLYKQTSSVNYSITPSAEKCHVTYNANGATSGDVPVDNNEYEPSDVVTVLGNTGKLAKTGHTWNGWNTDAEGNGDSYNAGGEFTITANTTLYAQWTINEYSYTLTDDDNSEAELEVDGSPVAANANIQYNKEVTVNVVVSEGYVYHISVINDATSEAVTVNNDKFNMPASSVTVTVTSEVNPYATIELTSANMEQMDNAGTAYAYIKTITINGYNWEAKAFNTTNEKNYLQINTPGSGNPAGSYIKLPIVNGKIETITCTVNSSNRYLYFNTTNSTSNPIATGGNGTAATSITIDMTNVVYQTGYIVSSGSIQITNISVKYRPYQDMSGTTLPTTLDEDVAISIPSNTNATAIDLTIPASSGIIIKSGASLTVSGTLTNEGGNANKIIIEDGGQLVIANAVNATLQKSITGYDDEDDPDGWYTIASPVVGTDMSLSAIGDYDLFKYDETSHTWLNEYNHEDDFTSTSVAEGFLYANGANQTLPFAGEMKASNAEVTKALTYSSTDGKLKGFNLVGNPFTCNLTSSMVKMNGETLSTYYVSEGHANLKVRTLASTPIKPGQGFFVQAPSACDLVFNPSSKDEMDYKPTFISIEAGNSEFTDMAYIQLGYGNTLRKMSINDNTPLVYVMNEGADYAAATVDELKGSMPICFKAASTGQYTISVNTEGLDMSYLHLIDRFTGEDVNLLLEPTYSFITTKGDNESRFILSFTANCFNDSESETFAYQAGNDIFVSGEGELQIFDVTGRMVSTTYVNGIETIKLPSSGMYIFRLVGTEVKTQKIVVR